MAGILCSTSSCESIKCGGVILGDSCCTWFSNNVGAPSGECADDGLLDPDNNISFCSELSRTSSPSSVRKNKEKKLAKEEWVKKKKNW